jgi:2-polyprenyl-3-methyl-5-hydroxy-6-metoxy-1,4-benzoquinol methylase
MNRYPKSIRNDISHDRECVSDEDRQLAQRFDRIYFDTERKFGYGGYYYHPRFFKDVVEDFIYYFKLKPGDKILDVGCAKGFMLHDFKSAIPDLDITGIDISDYVISEALPDVKQFLHQGCCSKLPFDDNSFDLVISISTIHNLNLNGVRQALREIVRVSRGRSFIKINGYKNLRERDELERWNLVAKTILRESEWEELFAEVGYEGDYDFFKP